MKYLVALCVVLSLSSARAADWEIAKEKNGITIETRAVAESGLKEFRGRMNLKARLNSLVALMYDLDKAPKWMHDNKSLSLDEDLGPQDRWLYLVNGAPWPLKTRDSYVHAVTKQDPVSKAVELNISADPSRKPEAKKMVRIQKMTGGWSFLPKADGSVDVTYAMFVDPGGSVPKALVNVVVVDNPYNTMKGMKRMLKTGAYDDAEMGWITEP